MRPPICDICGKEFPNEHGKGDLVYFKKTDADEQWYEHAQNPGFVGHPPNAMWICDKYLEKAIELKTLQTAEGMSELKNHIAQEENPGFWLKFRKMLGFSS